MRCVIIVKIIVVLYPATVLNSNYKLLTFERKKIKMFFFFMDLKTVPNVAFDSRNLVINHSVPNSSR